MAPNIVLFMTDQLRRDALGCYGNEICKTPNLDKLAACTSSDLVEPFDPISKRHFSAGDFSSLTC